MDCAGVSRTEGAAGHRSSELKPKKSLLELDDMSPSVLTEAWLKSTKSKQFKANDQEWLKAVSAKNKGKTSMTPLPSFWI